MLKPFKDFIKIHQLFHDKDRILLAVSGGVDSMVMASLFKDCKLNFSIAHCNFKLRKKDSDEDEKFVVDWAQKWGVTIHTKSFETAQYSKDKGISTQMAAREMRYDWFQKLITKHGYKYIAIGSHLNDSIETFVLNATRGTGISGLRGILPKNGSIIRPLLFATKEDILCYSREMNIPFRQDISNDSVQYTRNKIRHQIIPILKEINPNLENTFISNFNILLDTESIYYRKVDGIISEVSELKDGNLVVNMATLKRYPQHQSVLFEIIKKYGYQAIDSKKILETGSSGKLFYSKTHELLINREELIIQPLKENPPFSVSISSFEESFSSPLNVKIEGCSTKDIDFNTVPNTAFLDKNKLELPLKIRKWQRGDFFYPLGMKGKKKLSDFFIDLKLSLFEKNNILILTSGKDIVWIIGHRVDDRFKISKDTKCVVKMTIYPDTSFI